MKLYEHYEHFIFDLDGTIYRGNKIIPGAADTINIIQSSGKKIVFVSNKTTESAQDYFHFLKNAGFNIEASQIVTSTKVIKNYLNKNHPKKKFFAIAEVNFIDELSNQSLTFTTNPNEIDIVIISLDRYYNNDKFEIACRAIEKGARFFAANIDATCPIENGEILDAGVIISALEKRTKRKLELHFGKPSDFMIEEIKKRLHFESAKTILIGDRLETDILMGNKMGVDTAIVSTGVKPSVTKNYNVIPTYHFSSIADLLEKFSYVNSYNRTSF